MARTVNKKILAITAAIAAGVALAALAMFIWSGDTEARAKESLDEARLYAQRGQYESAVIQYKNAIRYAPDNATAYVELADVYIKLGDINSAFSNARRAADKDPENVPALSKLAWMYNLAGQWPELRQTAMVIVSLGRGGREEAQAHAYLARSYYRDGDYERSALEFSRARDLDGEDVDSILALALVNSQRLNAPKDAEAEVAKLIARSKADSLNERERARAAIAAAKYYGATGKYKEAEVYYQTAIALEPKSALHYATLGDFYRSRGRDARSLALAEEAYKRAADLDAASSLGLGTFYRETGQRDRAIEVFSRAVASAPAPIFYQQLVESLVEKGDLAAARTHVDAMRKGDIGGNVVEYLDGRITLAAAAGKPERVVEAERLFETVTKKQPQFPHAHYYLGLCLVSRGMYDDGARSLQRTLDIAPGFREATVALAETYFRSYQLDKALAQARSLLITDGQDYYGNLIAGRTLLAQGNLAGARTYLRTAQQARPAEMEPYISLAEAASREGKYDAALKELEEAGRNVADASRAKMASALILRQQGRGAQALAAAEELAHTSPANTAAAAFYASLLWQEGRAEDAAKFLTARAEETGGAAYYTLMGDFQRTLGKHEEALAAYKKALAAAPGEAKALAGVAGTLIALGRKGEARENLRLLRAAGAGAAAADLMEARLLQSEGKAGEAATLLANCIRQNPSNSEAYYRLALVQQERGEPGRAIENLKSALQYNPSFVAARLTLAQMYYQSRFYEDALREAKQVRQAEDLDSVIAGRATTIVTGSLIETRRIGEAITEWSQVPPEIKSTGDYLVKLGYLYLMDQKFAQAEESFRAAAKALPEPSSALEGLARLHLAGGHYPEATQTVNAALEGRNDAATRVRLLQLSANISLLAGERDKALGALSMLLDACGDDARLLVQAGDSFGALGKSEEALDAYRRAAKADEQYLEAKYRMVAALSTAGKLDEAREMADGILKEHPDDFQSLALLAQIQLADNKPADAMRTLTRALALPAAQGKESAAARYLLATAHFRQQNSAAAENEIRKALMTDPALAPARLLLAKVLLLNRAFEEAALEARQVLRETPASAEAHGILGDVATFAGDFTAAAGHYRDAMAISRSAAVAIALSNALTNLGQQDEAVKAVADYVAAAPKDIATANVLANMQRARKDYAGAEATLKRALEAGKDDPRTLRSLAHVYRDAGRPADAAKLLEGALGNDDFPEAHVLLAGVYDIMERSGDAEETLRAGIRARKGYLPNYDALTLVLAEKGRSDEAVALLKRGIADNPKDETFYTAMAALYGRLGMAAEREKFLVETAARTAEFAEVGCDLGDLHFLKGDMKAAAAAYERALAYTPESTRAANGLAYALAESNEQLPRAIELASRARDKAPSDARTHDTLGWAYYKYGQYDKAVVNLTNADKLAGSKSSTVLYHLALAYGKLGAGDRARETAERLVKLDGSYQGKADVKQLLSTN